MATSCYNAGMGKLTTPPGRRKRRTAPRLTARLKEKRRKLASHLSKLERELAELDMATRRTVLTPEEFDRWLEELASGPDAPALPADWSRADLYDDHD
jgi:hypothetical protein